MAYISHICREFALKRIFMKFAAGRRLANVINCVNILIFQSHQVFRFCGGSNFWHSHYTHRKKFAVNTMA